MDCPEYRLSCQLQGHESDVRRICVCGHNGIATSSRDCTVRFWELDQFNKHKHAAPKIMFGHSSFVGPLAWIAPTERFPEGGLVSGGMDALVFVWDLRTGQPLDTLKGHGSQVTGIVLDGSDIVSSSVDCTVRRWRNGRVNEFWEAHKEAIQSIIRLPTGELITCSTDTTMKMWKDGRCIRTYCGHTDTVRGLALIDDLGILSASHDCSIRLWAITGQMLMEMLGHRSIIYSVDSHDSGLVVSGSEDCSAKIWKDGGCIQSIEHPGCVWDVKFLENGDIVTACSDGIVRIWTTNLNRTASSHEIDSYSSSLYQYKCSSKPSGGLHLEEFPGLDALQIPGINDGETKVVRDGESAVAYAWNMNQLKWDKIGNVVDGPENGGARPKLDGVEYDYVFDVDVGDGVPIRRLPYNRSDNPYETAEKWLLRENLPLSYHQQIVEFILKNSTQKDFSPLSSNCDPYTGASAYVPGRVSTTSLAATPLEKCAFKHIPKKGMLVFGAAQYEGILKKISEFNNSLKFVVDKKDMYLTELEIQRLEALVCVLKDSSRYDSSCFADVDIVLLLHLLKCWPSSMMFPVMDLLRMMVLHPDAPNKFSDKIKPSNDYFLEMIHRATTTIPTVAANLLTSIKTVCNMFNNTEFHNWLQNNRSEIIGVFSSCFPSTSRNFQLSYSTLILNYTVLLVEKTDEEGRYQLLSAALMVAEQETLDPDSQFRILVAIGSLILEGEEGVKKTAVELEVDKIAKKAMVSKEAKIAEVGNDIQSLLLH